MRTVGEWPPHCPLHRRDVGGARNAFAGTGPPSHWRSLIFRRIVAVEANKNLPEPGTISMLSADRNHSPRLGRASEAMGENEGQSRAAETLG
jgi:hypothetical protein